jgi:hypothetical protein
MPIFYRTPNCTFVNVGQSKPKLYRKPFHIGLLDYIYEQIVCANVHLKILAWKDEIEWIDTGPSSDIIDRNATNESNDDVIMKQYNLR